MEPESSEIREIDITRGARALAAMDLVRAVARIVIVVGVPISAFIVISDLHSHFPFGNRFLIWAFVSIAAMLVVLLGLSFAISTMRPLAGALVVAVAAGPALYGFFSYARRGSGTLEEVWWEWALSFSILGVVSLPLVIAWWRVSRLNPELWWISRPAPKLSGLTGLWRETFSVWPGVRQGWVKTFLSSFISYAATLLLWIGVVIVTPVLILFVFLVPLLTSKGPFEVVAPFVVILILMLVSIVVQNLLRSFARWCSRAALADKVERDPRPPILFLRSFQDDQVRLPERNRLTSLYHGILSLGTGRRRLDHILVEKFSRYGPALALGSPGEKNLPFGAARVYASHDNWKEVVYDLAAKSNHVVLVADSTPGVEWEVKTFLKPPLLHKTIFLCAPRSSDVRESPMVGKWLDQLGVKPGGIPILAVFKDKKDRMVLLRSFYPRSSQAFVVALQAFFRTGSDIQRPATDASPG